jgi:hypothetical protein
VIERMKADASIEQAKAKGEVDAEVARKKAAQKPEKTSAD